MSKRLEYFYDFSSPYAYLAHEEVQRVAERTGAELVWRPFFLGGLFKALGTALVPINAASEAKRAYFRKDLHRWAELRGLPYGWPTRFPMNTIAALRVVLQLQGREHAEAHARAAAGIFRAYWGEDRDISDKAVLADVLTGAGLDAEALLAGTADPDVKASLFAATDELFGRGGCGAPAFFVGDVGDVGDTGALHFWGQDRLAMVERVLGGWTPTHG